MVVEAKQFQLEQYKLNEMNENTFAQRLDDDNDNDDNYCMNVDYQKIGRNIKNALLKAKTEARLIIGLSGAIKVLSHEPQGTLFCFLAAASNTDAATHMHEVLLEAFCYEHDIYVIKVDCPLKLSRLLGTTSVETCCLIQKVWTNHNLDKYHNFNNDDAATRHGSYGNQFEQLNKAENFLVDYCEAYWDTSIQSIIQLPDTDNTNDFAICRSKYLNGFIKYLHNYGDYAQNANTITGHDFHKMQQLILKETLISQQHLTPEISLHLITSDCRLYHQPLNEVEHERLFPNDPYWAFYWPGGQALSRFILDNPKLFHDQSILDVGSGCAASSIAAIKSKALYAIANDIDEVAACAAIINGHLNSIQLERLKISSKNLIGCNIQENIILIGDLFYDDEIADKLLSWLYQLRHLGKIILIGDPGRHGLSVKHLSNMKKLMTYELTENGCLENNGFRYVNIWRFLNK